MSGDTREDGSERSTSRAKGEDTDNESTKSGEDRKKKKADKEAKAVSKLVERKLLVYFIVLIHLPGLCIG